MFLFILAEKWQSKDTLIAHSYLGHPASFRINNSLMYNSIKRRDFSSVNNTYLHAKSISPELEYSLSGNQIISYCHQHLVISDKLYNAFEHPWSKQTSGSSTTAAHFIGLLAMQGQCPELNKIRFAKILSAKVQEINYDRSLQWRLHFGAAYIYYSDKNYINAMIHLSAAWKLFPNYPDPGVFIVDIAEKSNNQALLIETLIKLQKQTSPNDTISWEQIKPLLHKYESKIYNSTHSNH